MNEGNGHFSFPSCLFACCSIVLFLAIQKILIIKLISRIHSIVIKTLSFSLYLHIYISILIILLILFDCFLFLLLLFVSSMQLMGQSSTDRRMIICCVLLSIISKHAHRYLSITTLTFIYLYAFSSILFYCFNRIIYACQFFFPNDCFCCYSCLLNEIRLILSLISTPLISSSPFILARIKIGSNVPCHPKSD